MGVRRSRNLADIIHKYAQVQNVSNMSTRMISVNISISVLNIDILNSSYFIWGNCLVESISEKENNFSSTRQDKTLNRIREFMIRNGSFMWSSVHERSLHPSYP